MERWGNRGHAAGERREMTVVTTVYRPKRPPRKKKAVPLAGPRVVTAKRAAAVTAPLPANDDGKPAPEKSAIVTTTSRKLLKLERADRRRADRPEDPEAVAEVKAFIARMIRPGGSLPPGVEE
jgi:hypothetical protein